MRRFLLVLMVSVIGCGDGGQGTVDAPYLSGSASSHTLFVQAEGLMLAKGDADATLNTSPIVQTPGTVTAWRAGDADRATKIAALVTELKTLVAPYGVNVTTTRPQAAPYTMIVVTDSAPAAIGLTPEIAAIMYNAPTCNSIPNEVGVVFAGQFGTTYTAKIGHMVAAEALAMFAHSNGVAFSTVTGDCMCFAAQNCGSYSFDSACTVGGANTAVDAQGACTAGSTMDEGAAMLDAFGPH